MLLDAFGGPVSKELEVSDLRLLIVDTLTIITLYLHACCSLHLRLLLLSSMPTMVSLLRKLLMRNLPFLWTVMVSNMLLMRDHANWSTGVPLLSSRYHRSALSRLLTSFNIVLGVYEEVNSEIHRNLHLWVYVLTYSDTEFFNFCISAFFEVWQQAVPDKVQRSKIGKLPFSWDPISAYSLCFTWQECTNSFYYAEKVIQ